MDMRQLQEINEGKFNQSFDCSFLALHARDLAITLIEQVQPGAAGTSFNLDPSMCLGSCIPSRKRRSAQCWI